MTARYASRCASCARQLAPRDARYVVHIELFAAADPLEIEPSDLQADLEAELRRLRHRLDEIDPAQALADVYSEFHFVICRACRGRFVAEPLRSAAEATRGDTR